MREIALDIAGIGIILYSPSAVAHIAEGEDYLSKHFSEPEDVARHVTACGLTAFATGSSGDFRVRFLEGPLDEARLSAADYKLRLGLEVRGGVVCVRDLYDLLQWSRECPNAQKIAVADGWFRLTVFTSLPPSGCLGDGQVIEIHMERWPERPLLKWDGAPALC